jgi:hypothetical protein
MIFDTRFSLFGRQVAKIGTGFCAALMYTSRNPEKFRSYPEINCEETKGDDHHFD